jgi:hypothetical protein
MGNEGVSALNCYLVMSYMYQHCGRNSHMSWQGSLTSVTYGQWVGALSTKTVKCNNKLIYYCVMIWRKVYNHAWSLTEFYLMVGFRNAWAECIIILNLNALLLFDGELQINDISKQIRYDVTGANCMHLLHVFVYS